MTTQYSLANVDQKKILDILRIYGVDVEPAFQEEDADGRLMPIHREISIEVSSYDDESEEFDMYISVD